MMDQSPYAGALSGSVDETMEAIRQGRVVMIVDPVRPERGGVLVAAAERVNDDLVNFMATHARGLVAVALAPERTERLGLRLQGPWTTGLDRENYTTSIEGREGVSTGISAADRARTVRVTADYRTRPEDLSVPGHVFPAQGDPQGLLGRQGWAEACLDLARLAGAQPAMAFCQILDQDGEIAGVEHLSALASHHGIPGVGIAGIISYRMTKETFVVQRIQSTLPTRHGEFLCRVFENRLDGKEHLAYTLGEVRSAEPLLVRLHSECLTGDVFGSLRCDCGAQLNAALESIREEGRGALLYLQQEGRGIGIVNKVQAYRLQDEGRDTVEANLELGFEADQRDFGVGAQMLMALGAQRIRLLTNNPRKVRDLESYGLEVVERIPLEFEPGEYNRPYLEAKRDKLGHLLSKI